MINCMHNESLRVIFDGNALYLPENPLGSGSTVAVLE